MLPDFNYLVQASQTTLSIAKTQKLIANTILKVTNVKKFTVKPILSIAKT